MLQQTRVEAVIPYYHRFLARFPTVEALAEAPESDVLALWSGLGYYSRARSLHRAAKQIAACGPPADYAEVRDLPGVGPYTAAAVASIALGLAHAAVDGNVLRVMSRLNNDARDHLDRGAPVRLDGRRASRHSPARRFQSGHDGTGRHGLPAPHSRLRSCPVERSAPPVQREPRARSP